MNLESGRSRIDFERARQLADALGIETEDILGDDAPRSAIKQGAVRLIDALDDSLVEPLIAFLSGVAARLPLSDVGSYSDLSQSLAVQWETDEEHRFVPANVPVNEKSRWESRDLGKTHWELDGCNYNDKTFWERHRADMIAHRPFHDFTYTRVVNDHVWIVQSSGRPFFAPNGDFLGYRGRAILTPMVHQDGMERAVRRPTGQPRASRWRLRSRVIWHYRMNAEHRFTENIPGGSYGVRDFVEFRAKYVEGKTRWDLAGADVEKDEKWRDHKATLDNHRPFKDFVYETFGPNGMKFRSTASGEPTYGESGEFLGYRGVTFVDLIEHGEDFDDE